MINSILYFGRKNCEYSDNLKTFLSKKSKKFYYIESKKMYEKLPNKNFLKKNFTYIICFRSFYILRKKLINKASIATINFHPGPPEYRGAGCVNYALYNNSKFYGVTSFIINEKIDNGKILDVKKFKLTKKDNVESTLNKAYKIMLEQAKTTLTFLFKDQNNLKKLIKINKQIKWSKKIKNVEDLNNFYEIKINSTKKELLKKIRATNTKSFKPYIKLHSKKFIYQDN
jgi:methionyl-tRNA formyltransferase